MMKTYHRTAILIFSAASLVAASTSYGGRELRPVLVESGPVQAAPAPTIAIAPVMMAAVTSKLLPVTAPNVTPAISPVLSPTLIIPTLNPTPADAPPILFPTTPILFPTTPLSPP